MDSAYARVLGVGLLYSVRFNVFRAEYGADDSIVNTLKLHYWDAVPSRAVPHKLILGRKERPTAWAATAASQPANLQRSTEREVAASAPCPVRQPFLCYGGRCH